MAKLLLLCIKEASYLLFKLIPFVLIGFFIAESAYRIPSLKKIGNLFNPISKLARIPEYGPLYLTTSLFNPLSATMILVELRKRHLITDNGVVVFALSSGFPVSIHYTLIWAVPVCLSMLGIGITALFTSGMVIVGLFQSVTGILYSRYLKGELELEKCLIGSKSPHLPLKRILTEAIGSSIKGMIRIVRILYPILFVVFVLKNSGIMTWITKVTMPILDSLKLTSSSAELITVSSLNFFAACSIAKGMLLKRILSSFEIVLSFILGSFIYSLGELWHTTLPYNIAFFGVRLGTRVALSLWITFITGKLLIITIFFSYRYFS